MSAPAIRDTRTGAPGVFMAVLWRDIFVTGRELPVFLAQVILQPLFMLFVFGKVLSNLGYTRPGYAHLLFPGIVALTALLTSLQSTALPLVLEFSFTKEIEDRLLAPIPTALVAVEKMIFAAMRALIAAVCMFPIGVLILGSVPWRAAGAPPNRISIAFSLVLTPLLFTGCSQYPWPTLDSLRWFQIVTLFNPLTYVSEGMRGALVPYVPHMRPWVCVVALLFWLAVFSAIGIRGFIRRAID